MGLAHPPAELLRIVQQAFRRGIIGEGRGIALLAPRVGEGLGAVPHEIRPVAVAGFQIDLIIHDQANHQIAHEDAFAAEHAADGDAAKSVEKIVETVRSGSPQAKGMVRWTIPFDGRRALGRAAEVALQDWAGVICTLSPQPQAEVWFGLLKTNRAPSFSCTKSSSVPIRNRMALGSMKIFTPLSSITSSKGLASVAYSMV